MIGMSIGDPDAPGQPPEIMLAMATCMQALAALPEPTAEKRTDVACTWWC